MKRLHRSTITMITITAALAILAFFGSIFLGNVDDTTRIGLERERGFRISNLEYRLKAWTLPEKTREILEEVPPGIADIDYSKRLTTSDMLWMQFSIRAEEATEEYFKGLMEKEYDNLSAIEIKQLIGYLLMTDTLQKMETPFYKGLIEYMGFDNTEDALNAFNYFIDYVPMEVISELVEYYSIHELYDMYEEGKMFYRGTNMLLETLVLNSMAGLPEKYRDPNVELSRKETRELLEICRMEQEPRMLLPQVRRNAEKYGFNLHNDTIHQKIRAFYIEDKFLESGLLKD